jgi:uncharacterized protein YdeI (YjbR/CyaY-like superfamily)
LAKEARLSDIAIPGELKKALAARPAALAAFEKLPPSHKAEYVRWIMEAKTPDMRARRAGQAAARLTGGG